VGIICIGAKTHWDLVGLNGDLMGFSGDWDLMEFR
jgi:hypothetical protein